MEAIPNPVIYKDLGGHILGCNEEFTKFHGVKEKDIIGKKTTSFVQADVVSNIYETENDLISTKSKVTFESVTKNAAGEPRNLIVTKDLFYDIKGEPAGIVGVMQDITELKQSEQALKASEEKVRSIIDNLTVGVTLLSPELKVLEINRQMRAWLKDLKIGEKPFCYTAFPSPTRTDPCKSCPVQATLRDGKIHETTTRNACAGQSRDLRIISTPIKDDQGSLTGCIELFEDITEMQAMQRELVQSQKMASIGQLSAGVAHEINNPTGFVSSNLMTLRDYLQDLNEIITAYRGLKDELKSRSQFTEHTDVAAMIENIEELEDRNDLDYISSDSIALIDESSEGTERIKKIVEDLKHFAHPGQDKVQDTDINKELATTLNIVNNELKYKATVVTEFGELPIISANPQQLNQVFANILVNAAHAIEKEGKILIKTRQLDQGVEILIRDTGCGIAEENLGKIFDPFFTTKEVGKGTGLGMNIAYNIVQKHQGEIRVESRLGEGTTFIIQLPIGNLSEDGASNCQATAAG
jgi:PAS domain S-box-containing protein